MKYFELLKKTECTAGEVVIQWLGQAGFILKNSQGKILVIDAYLSKLSERLDGNKRIMPAIMQPEEIESDVILISHEHTDHLDVDSLPVMLKNGARMYCNGPSVELCKENGISLEHVIEIKEGDSFEDSGYRVDVVFADHGDGSPEAVGFIVETEGINLYFPSDTSYQSARMQPKDGRRIDILITPINGQYGNMNENDAAMLSKQLHPALTIPSHFWTFVRHQGNPYLFEGAMLHEAPENPFCIMAQGEIIVCDRSGIK